MVHHVIFLVKWPTWRTILLYVFIYIFLTLYMFLAHRAHHQERQIVSIQPLVAVTLFRWPCCVQVGSDIDNLCQINSVHIPLSYFSKINFKKIHLRIGLPNGFFFHVSPPEHYRNFASSPYVPHALPIPTSWFDRLIILGERHNHEPLQCTHFSRPLLLHLLMSKYPTVTNKREEHVVKQHN